MSLRKPSKKPSRVSSINVKRKPRKPAGKKNPARKRRSVIRRTIRFFTLITIWTLIIGIILVGYYLHDLPSTDKLTKSTGNYQIRIVSADGELITNMGGIYGSELNYNEIPKNLIDAVVATEDRRFFEHFGFDIYGFARAMYTNIKEGRIVQGGSTITQQLAKIVFLSPERTLKRKVQELMLAIWLEHRFTKKQLMTMYLNRVYLGAGYFGVDAAARGYFGKETRNLNLNEAAMIAGLLKAPSRYSPFADEELAKKRATQVMVNMIDAGYISVADAINVGSVIRTRAKSSNSRFYFSDWLASQIPDYIGIIDSDLVITTTLDLRLQKYAEEAVNDVLLNQGAGRNANQSALVAMSPRGEILAMVGGKDYSKSQFNRATQAQRQPGSSFKFFVYLAALKAGYLPSDLFVDQEIEVEGWKPENYDGVYKGDITMKEAFAYSINSVAVQLSEMVGRFKVIKQARELGIDSPIKPLPSLALGTNEVNLLEMVQAYSHLPNEGFRVEAYGIKEIKTKDGRIIYKRRGSESSRVVDPKVVAEMNKLMKSVMEEGTGRRSRLLRETGGKSGTTQDFRDAWFIGYTPQVVTGVWVGNDDNSPMDGVTGGSLAGQIWKKFMTETLSNIDPVSIPTSTSWFNWFKWGGDDAESEKRRTFWDKIMDKIETEETEEKSP